MSRTPVPPIRLNPDLPPRLEDIINKALEKDRNLRYQSAAEMRTDLQRLKRDSESHQSPVATDSSSWYRKKWLPWVAAAVVGIVAATVTLTFLLRQSGHPSASPAGSIHPKSIAVLPLQNMNGDANVEFLRFALADEIANTLTYTPSLDVRPSSVTQKYVGNYVDPQQAGKELRVADILAGHFLKQGDRLMITLEAIQVEGNRLLWQSNMNAPAQDLIGLQAQMAAKVRQELLPVLGAAAGFLDTGTRPKNAEAYDLYLHSLALPHDVEPNKAAIAVLEHVVEIDPSYAPAWEQLGLRCYYDADYSDGGQSMYKRSDQAYERAIALDPNRMVAAGQLIDNRVERGELGKAYQDAEALVKRRPESAQAHFTAGYVYRYAGMLERSANECNTALALDPGNYVFRSCAWSFMELGKTERARDFVRLDAGSEWAAYIMPSLLLREGKIQEARDAVKRISYSPRYYRNQLEACLQMRPAADLDRMAHEVETSAPSEPDPEPWYARGTIFAFCGKKQAALHLLEAAVNHNYCAFENLKSDPLLAKLREEDKDKKFEKLLTAAGACQQAVVSDATQKSH